MDMDGHGWSVPVSQAASSLDDFRRWSPLVSSEGRRIDMLVKTWLFSCMRSTRGTPTAFGSGMLHNVWSGAASHL
jgi:hypothetical protein